MRTKFLSLEDARDFLFGSDPSPESNPLSHPRKYSGEKVAKAVFRIAIEQDLTDRQRECVMLYYVQGLTMDQVGERLGITKSVVYRHLERARTRLERALVYAQTIQRYLEEE